MKMFFVLACSMLSLNAFAQRVESTELQYVGRAIEDKKTGDVISLVCMTDCHQLRFVYFKKSTGEAVYYGDPLAVQTDDSPVTRKEIKKTLKRFKKSYQRHIGRKNNVLENRYSAFLAFVLGGAFVLKNVPLPPEAELIFVGAIFVGMSFVYFMYEKPVFGSAAKVSRVLHNQKGWNWSNRVRRIKSKNFETLKRYSGYVDLSPLP